MKVIENELICNSNSPDGWFGNKSSNIGFANTIIPTVLGIPISTEISIENLIFLLASSKSLLAFAEDTTGISVLVKAELNDSGNDTNVSIFPLKIPYSNFASVVNMPLVCFVF